MYYFLNIFFVFSIIGYFLETLFIKGYESGIMYLPWTPIYGIGILIIVFIFKRIKDKVPKIIEIILLLVISGIILSVIEFIGGHIIEYFFKKIYWNYDYLKYNLGKYVSLESALIWGIGSVAGLYLVLPIVKRIEKYIPKALTIILCIIFIIDFFITCIVKMP